MFHDHVETTDPNGSSDDLTPSGNRLVYGAFVQDRLTYSDWLEVIGALRYDAYSLTGNGIDNQGSHVSPKLTIGITPFEPVSFYATYAEGYRAPAITETLIDGFHPPPVGTGQFTPNPDLKPEIAHSIEGGVNLRFDDLVRPDDRLRIKLGVFHNRVNDFIEQVFTPFPIPGGYQYQNVSVATIEGFEAEGNYDAGTFFASFSGQIMQGVNARTKAELASVPPNRLMGILGFRAFDGALEAGTKITAAAGKSGASDLGLVGDPYELVDLFATWKLSETATAAVYLGNIFDVRYTVYPNGRPSPGFNAKFSLTVKIGAEG